MTSRPSPPEPSEDDAWSTRRALEVLGLSLVFPVAIFVGFWLGSRVGAWLGGPLVGGIVGGAAGAVAGLWELYRLVLRGQPGR